jgi:hypothetical protein
MSNRTVLEFAMGNPNNLNETQLWYFIDNQNFLVIKEIFITESGIKFNLSIATEYDKVVSFSDAYKEYNNDDELLKKSKALIKPANETIDEFSIGNQEKLNEKQILNFIENQDIIIIKDFILSNHRIKLIVETHCTQSDTIAFTNAFKEYSQNVEEIIEEIVCEIPKQEEVSNNTEHNIKNGFFHKISNYFNNFISS